MGGDESICGHGGRVMRRLRRSAIKREVLNKYGEMARKW